MKTIRSYRYILHLALFYGIGNPDFHRFSFSLLILNMWRAYIVIAVRVLFEGSELSRYVRLQRTTLMVR